jgi:hypothetical protein
MLRCIATLGFTPFRPCSPAPIKANTVPLAVVIRVWTSSFGAYLGTHYCGTPTVADDVTLLSNDPYELQSMLDIQTSHANSKRYLISEQKSSILTFNCTKGSSVFLDRHLIGFFLKYLVASL